MFAIFQYNPSESINHPHRGRLLIRQGYATREAALEDLQGRLSHSFDVTGYNEEQDYYWGRMTSTMGPRIILRIEG